MNAPRFVIPLALVALGFGGALWALKEPHAHERAMKLPLSVVRTAPSLRRGGAPIGAAPLPSAVRPRAPSVSDAIAADPPPDTDYTASVSEAAELLNLSGNTDDRVRAVRSLAASAREGDDVAYVRSSLRVASADDDPDVAARAQEEYERLIDREDR